MTIMMKEEDVREREREREQVMDSRETQKTLTFQQSDTGGEKVK